MERTLTIHARPWLIIAADLGGFVLGAILLILLAMLGSLISPLAFSLLIAVWGLSFALDILRWYRSGIRAIRLDSSGLTVRCGARSAEVKIAPADVSEVAARRRFWRRTLIVHLKPPASRGSAQGALLRPRRARRLRITDDAFTMADFSLLATALQEWGKPHRHGRGAAI